MANPSDGPGPPPSGVRSLLAENELLAAIVATQQEVATADLDPDTVMRVIAERARSLTGATGATVELAEGDEMVYRAAAGATAAHLGLRLKVAASLSGLCVRTGELLRCDDSEADDRVDREACRRVDVRSMIVVPLCDSARTVGVLKILSDRTGAFSNRDAHTLQLMTGLLGAALSKARAFEAERAKVAVGEGAVRAAERRFAAFMDNSPLLAFMKDAQGRYTYINESVRRRFNVSTADWLGKTDAELLPPPLARRAGDYDAAALAGTPVEYEQVVPTLDGGPRHWLVSKFPFPSGSGPAIGGLALDVTERKEATRSRDEALAVLDTLLNSAPFGIAFIDPDLRYVRINGTRAALNGPPPDAHIGRGVEEMLPPQLAHTLVPVYRRVLATGEGVRDTEVSLAPPGEPGKARHFLADCYPVYGPDRQVIGIGSIMSDVTEKRGLEERYRQSQKMEAVGQLAGGVAHDFNNLLTVISGHASLLLEGLPPGAPDRESINEIYLAAERAASLTRQLLAFSRQQVLEPKVLSLNRIVTGAELMLRRLIGEDVRLATATAAALRPVRADAGQLEQVLLNLVVNARDAMPTGGRLTIETANVDLDGWYAAARPEVAPGRYAMLAVSDTGTGMPPDVQARVFEPFFTTKGPGKGTGLGLATVFGIVKQSGGFVAVYSEPGRGTTFKVYLPAVEQPVPAPHAHGPQTTIQGDETVLVAEDDEAVRAVVRLALRAHGYAVLEAGGGEEAVRAAEAHAGPIHLLVTDVVMPEVGGRELAERLTALRSGLRVLYLSGYTDDAVVRHGVLEAHVHFLQKPFTPAGLAAKVREVLDQPGAARHSPPLSSPAPAP